MSEIRIVSVTLAEAPPSSQMYIRPFKASWDDRYTDQLFEATNDGTNLSANAVARVAQQALTPSAQHMGAAHIANGFGAERLTVTMVIEKDNVGGRKTHEIINGYTDFIGFHDNLGKAVYADDMRFFFNSMGTLTVTSGFGMEGYGSYQFTNSAQILTPLQGWDGNDQIPVIVRDSATIRPKDLLANLGTAQTGTPAFGNSTYQFTNRVKPNSRSNNVSSEYLSRVFTGFRDAMLNSDTDNRQFPNQLQAASETGYINDPLATSSALLQLLQRRTSFAQEWSVTLRELKNVDPTITQRITPVRMRREDRDRFGAVLHGSSLWHETTPNAQVAQTALLHLPSVMSRFVMGRLHFEAHNETMNGFPHVTIFSMQGSVPGINLDGLVEQVRQYLATEVYPVLNQCGKFNLRINCDISLNRISTIQVSINNQPLEPFMVASYADSAFSPCWAPNVNHVSTLASDLSGVCAQLAAAAINSGPGILNAGGQPVRSISYGPQPTAAVNIQNQPGGAPSTGGLGF